LRHAQHLPYADARMTNLLLVLLHLAVMSWGAGVACAP
jgi:hypothetical protein